MIVYKYPIHIQPGQQILMLPRGAKILAFQTQNDQPFIWVLVDRDATQETRKFWVFGTGHEIMMNRMSYVGTIQQGTFVWHLWEIPMSDAAQVIEEGLAADRAAVAADKLPSGD